MFTKRRTCPESSRKCLLIAGKRCSISPSKSGSVSELHSMVCTPSVKRRSAEGISTVIFFSIYFPGLQLKGQRLKPLSFHPRYGTVEAVPYKYSHRKKTHNLISY